MSIFPDRWPVQNPDQIQLYTANTPNGVKATIALEELGLPYELHKVDIMKGDQFDPGFVAIQPNSKIPCIVDPDGPGGEPLAIMESGAILHHLARKTGQLMPTDPRGESEVLQWLFFQIGSVGPMFGQFGHFYKFAKGKTDAYGENRYAKEVERLLGVLESRLDGRDWICDDYSVADIALAPWVGGLAFYEAHQRVGYARFTRVQAWQDRFMERPAVIRGRDVVA